MSQKDVFIDWVATITMIAPYIKTSHTEEKMYKITSFLVTSLLLLTLSCNNTSPHKDYSELTVHLSTSNYADVIEGEVFLQNNSDKSRFYRCFALESIASFSGIETGSYSLILYSQKIEDNIRISEKKNTLFIDLDETEISSIMKKARQSYFEQIIEFPEATIDDVSFWPFMGIFDACLVAVFLGGEYHGGYEPPGDIVEKQEIGGLPFSWGAGYPILVYHENYIFELAEAFEKGLLTKDNLETIHNFYNENPFWYIEI